MYIYYVLRGRRGEESVEFDGDVNEEQFPGVKLSDGPAVINYLVQHIRKDERVEWTECDLTDDFFDREDNYLNFNGRWKRRADAPWRKDRDN